MFVKIGVDKLKFIMATSKEMWAGVLRSGERWLRGADGSILG